MIDGDFFREFFILYVGEYAEHRGLQQNPAELKVAVELTDDTELLVLAWRAGPGWIVMFTEDDQMQTVPYEQIRRVSVQPRPQPLPAPPPRLPVGFSAVSSVPPPPGAVPDDDA